MTATKNSPLHFYYKKEGEERFTRIDSEKKGCWIHIPHATAEALEKLSKIIGIDEIDLQDALDPFEIPRIEQGEKNFIIYTRHPSERENGLYTSTLTFVLTDAYFVTISLEDPLFIDQLLKGRSSISTSQKTKLLTQILMKMTSLFTAEIKKVRTIVLKREKSLQNVESEDIKSVTKQEEILNQYLYSLKPTSAVLTKIKEGKKLSTLFEKDQDLIEDLYYTVTQSEEICTIHLKTIQSLRDAYQIIFTNNLSKTIKLLTALTIILSLPTMIASIYGMNIKLPFAENPLAFVFILFLIAFSLIIAFKIFKRKKWL